MEDFLTGIGTSGSEIGAMAAAAAAAGLMILAAMYGVRIIRRAFMAVGGESRSSGWVDYSNYGEDQDDWANMAVGETRDGFTKTSEFISYEEAATGDPNAFIPQGDWSNGDEDGYEDGDVLTVYGDDSCHLCNPHDPINDRCSGHADWLD